jgi:hypothetical protein
VQLDTDPGALLNGASGLLMVALGLGVLLVRPRRTVHVALAGFLVGIGVSAALQNLWPLPAGIGTLGAGDSSYARAVAANGADPASAWFRNATVVANSLAGLAAYALALRIPVPFSWSKLRTLALPAAACTAIVLVGFVGMWRGGLSVGTLLYHSGFAFLALTLPMRYIANEDARRRTHVTTVAAAVFLFSSVNAGQGLQLFYVAPENLGRFIRGPMLAASLLLASALWLRRSALAEGADARRCAAVALVVPAFMLAGLVLMWRFSESFGMFGIARLVGMGLLTYAILRHQLLDIEVKLKWTINRGTLAGVFLAVFFIVAQLAQSYLSSELGLLAGGVAAGLMLFALTPLQRFAERVADTAMPGVKAASAMSAAERVQVYRDAAHEAWSDGVLERNERALLDKLQQSLRLSRDEAMRIEQEAARGAGP